MPQIPMTDVSGNDQNILNWWRDSESGFPHLIKMARQFLSAPASFASAESRLQPAVLGGRGRPYGLGRSAVHGGGCGAARRD